MRVNDEKPGSPHIGVYGLEGDEQYRGTTIPKGRQIAEEVMPLTLS